LTLPDGSARLGQVLEVQGKKAVVQVRFFDFKNVSADAARYLRELPASM